MDRLLVHSSIYPVHQLICLLSDLSAFFFFFTRRQEKVFIHGTLSPPHLFLLESYKLRLCCEIMTLTSSLCNLECWRPEETSTKSPEMLQDKYLWSVTAKISYLTEYNQFFFSLQQTRHSGFIVCADKDVWLIGRGERQSQCIFQPNKSSVPDVRQLDTCSKCLPKIFLSFLSFIYSCFLCFPPYHPWFFFF